MTSLSILISTVIAGIALLVISEKDYTTQLTRDISRLGIIRFDRSTPYVKLPTHWQKIDWPDLLVLIRNLIDPNDRDTVKSTQIAEIAKRLMENLTLQLDVEGAYLRQQFLINLLNGVYDSRTGQFSTDRGNYIFDYVINVNYVEQCDESKCPNFLHFIVTSAGKENANCLWNLTGYTLSSISFGKVGGFLLGDKDGGKSTYLRFIESCFAPELVSHVSFQQFSDPYFTLQLQGKKVNISYDNSGTPMGNEHIFKSIVSCERIQGRALRQNPVQFTANVKLLFASNLNFAFKHPDSAIYRRMIIVPFEYSIPADKQDPALIDKLISERDIICSLAVRRLPRLIESKFDFQMSVKGKAYLESRIVALNSVEGFLNDRMTVDEKGSVSAASLYETYKLWCNENALDADDKGEFKESVLAYNPDIDYKKVGPSSKRVWGFKGIRLKTADEFNAPDTEGRK